MGYFAERAKQKRIEEGTWKLKPVIEEAYGRIHDWAPAVGELGIDLDLKPFDKQCCCFLISRWYYLLDIDFYF
jgi:hypothetical protein